MDPLPLVGAGHAVDSSRSDDCVRRGKLASHTTNTAIPPAEPYRDQQRREQMNRSWWNCWRSGLVNRGRFLLCKRLARLLNRRVHGGTTSWIRVSMAMREAMPLGEGRELDALRRLELSPSADFGLWMTCARHLP